MRFTDLLNDLLIIHDTIHVISTEFEVYQLCVQSHVCYTIVLAIEQARMEVMDSLKDFFQLKLGRL